MPSTASAGVPMSATICGHSASRTAASTTETPIKSGQAHECHGDHIERLSTICHGGDAGGAAKLPHHVQVGHAVEHLQKVREHIRQGKDRDGLKDIAACEVVFHERGTFWLGFFTYQCSENPTTIVESRFVSTVGRNKSRALLFRVNMDTRHENSPPALTLQKTISEYLTPLFGAQ